MASADAPVQGAVEAARAEAAAADEARRSAVAERNTARQMLQGVKAMLAQSEALRQSADNSQPLKVRCTSYQASCLICLDVGTGRHICRMCMCFGMKKFLACFH